MRVGRNYVSRDVRFGGETGASAGDDITKAIESVASEFVRASWHDINELLIYDLFTQFYRKMRAFVPVDSGTLKRAIQIKDPVETKKGSSREIVLRNYTYPTIASIDGDENRNTQMVFKFQEYGFRMHPIYTNWLHPSSRYAGCEKEVFDVNKFTPFLDNAFSVVFGKNAFKTQRRIEGILDNNMKHWKRLRNFYNLPMYVQLAKDPLGAASDDWLRRMTPEAKKHWYKRGVHIDRGPKPNYISQADWDNLPALTYRGQARKKAKKSKAIRKWYKQQGRLNPQIKADSRTSKKNQRIMNKDMKKTQRNKRSILSLRKSLKRGI